MFHFYLYLREIDGNLTMKQHNYKNKHAIAGLISEYEAMSQKGTVGFLEEKAFNQLIEYYTNQSKIDRALEVVDHALSQYSLSPNFYIKKAQLLMKNRQEALAITSLEQAQIYAPSEIDIYIFRAEILCTLKRYEEALTLLNELKPFVKEKDLSEVYLCEAQIYEYRHQFEEMFYTLKKILFKNPRNDEALKRLWLCLELSNMFTEGIELYLQLIDEDPYSYLVWYNLGHAYNCINDTKNAAIAFEYAFLIEASFHDAYIECAAANFKLKKYKKALQCFEEALDHFEADSIIIMNIGRCYEALNDISVAKVFYLKAIQLSPNNDEAHYWLAKCLVKENQLESAIKTYLKAIDLEDRREEYYIGLANCYWEMQEHKLAKFVFEKAIETAPEQISCWLLYASFLIDLRKYNESIRVLDEAEANTSSDDIRLYYCRIACLFLKGRQGEALYRLGEVLDENFKSHTCIFDFAPELEKEEKILALIEKYKGKC